MAYGIVLTLFTHFLLLQFVWLAHRDAPMALLGLLPIQLLGAVGYSWEFA